MFRAFCFCLCLLVAGVSYAVTIESPTTEASFVAARQAASKALADLKAAQQAAKDDKAAPAMLEATKVSEEKAAAVVSAAYAHAAAMTKVVETALGKEPYADVVTAVTNDLTTLFAVNDAAIRYRSAFAGSSLAVLAGAADTPEKRAAFKTTVIPALSQMHNIRAMGVPLTVQESALKAVTQASFVDGAVDLLDYDAAIQAKSTTFLPDVLDRHTDPNDPILMAVGSAQDFVNRYKMYLRRTKGRVVQADLEPMVAKIVNNTGNWTTAPSNKAKALGAKLPEDSYIGKMYRGEFMDAAVFAFNQSKLAPDDGQYLNWVSAARSALVCNDLYYNGRALDFVKWVNGEGDACPITEFAAKLALLKARSTPTRAIKAPDLPKGSSAKPAKTPEISTKPAAASTKPE